MPMRLRGLLIAPLLLVPAAASARDIAACAALYRQLNNTRQVIGNTAEMRRYAQQLSRQNSVIRQLRIEMRSAGCGTGSIIALGDADSEICQEIRDQLQQAEANRDGITDERNNARQLVQSSDERTAILAAIRSNSCIPSDVEEDQKERMKVQGIELPKEEPYSGITNLRTTPPEQPQAAAVQPNLPGPERPYDPNRKVRMVGPQFLPEENIDLAHPKSSGPQPQQ
ncbi:hypothetical protein QTA58_21310 [Neorhizobium sp. CSC1952]|uniref:hypothetical protein n=1 Tax=Neorhizobium sp. CSC1952 TaxID=2978974 RepID=UPI0025A5704B|nr:hypothetical protein [Rhizobium sp. CSC1952]WJR66713.1 hypothetical protein QTA58_21310 [Rhizobium sp. CSC1952]